MSKKKIMIAESADGYPYWGPLMPIVEFCLARGCKLDGKTPEQPFFEDRNGSNLCLIVGDVTVKDILGNFSFPDHVKAKSRSNIKSAIVDIKHRSSITITSFAEFEKVLKEREEYNERQDKRLLESRKRRAERDKLRYNHDEDQ